MNPQGARSHAGLASATFDGSERSLYLVCLFYTLRQSRDVFAYYYCRIPFPSFITIGSYAPSHFIPSTTIIVQYYAIILPE